jgi:hypothetical protein
MTRHRSAVPETGRRTDVFPVAAQGRVANVSPISIDGNAHSYLNNVVVYATLTSSHLAP